MSEPLTIRLELDTVERLALLSAIEHQLWHSGTSSAEAILLRELRDRIRAGLGEVS